MQIRLVIGEQDSRYLNNLITFLEKNHMDKLEIFSFSRPDMFQNYFAGGSADVILIDENFGISAESLLHHGKVAYLCDSAAENGSDPVRRILKYKKPDLIYKDIIDLYAEGGSRNDFHISGNNQGNLVLVTSCSGGTGASTFAAALAKKYASRGKKVLYLNLEKTGSSTDFFSGAGDYRFEDVIFALKSQRADVKLKMESTVRTDRSGVCYFEPCSTAMYMCELNHEDIMKTLDVLGSHAGYDHIVIDMNFDLTADFMEVMSRMNRIVLVQDGGETSNTKFQRTMQAVHVMEEQNKLNVTGNMLLVYNKFSSSKSSSDIPELSIPVLGKIPPIKHALVGEIIDYMQGLQNIFETL